MTSLLSINTTHSESWKIAPLWHPEEALGKPDANGFREIIPKKKRKKKLIPTLNRKLFNTIEKHGPWLSADWPFLVNKLIDAGMRKRNLAFRIDHKRNLENAFRWIAYHSDAVTGCINVIKLCIEIGKEIKVSSSTISLIMKELVAMGILYEPDQSGKSIQDLLHGGHLPRTLCATPLFYDLLGIRHTELLALRSTQILYCQHKAEKENKTYDQKAALDAFCYANTLRVWESRHTKENSSYKKKLSQMKPLERMAYIAKNLVKRIKSKGWNISVEKNNIMKMAANLLGRMGFSVKQQDPIPI